MIVYVLFAQMKEDHPGEFAPEAVTAVDEYTLENVTLEELERRQDLDEDNYVATRWVKVSLNATEADIRKLLLAPPEITGKVDLPKEPKGDHPSYQGMTVTIGREGKKIEDSEIID